jgi:hypothetical protein
VKEASAAPIKVTSTLKCFFSAGAALVTAARIPKTAGIPENFMVTDRLTD